MNELFETLAQAMKPETKHVIKTSFNGNGESSFIQNMCSCGFIGKKFYAYQDFQ